jgi:hypothetical protein
MAQLFSNKIFNFTGYEMPTLTVIAAVCSLVAVLIPLLRWAALPKPFPGIPHNETSASRVQGDVPEMTKTGRVRFWLREQFAVHNSPIVQVFVNPFSKPWILVSDFREAHDVMTRRTKEFDKSNRTCDSFVGVMADSFVSMKTPDHRFKHNKELLKDLMTSSFLNDVRRTDALSSKEAH